MTPSSHNIPSKNYFFSKPLIASIFFIVLASIAFPLFRINYHRTDIVRSVSDAKGIKSALDLFAGDFEGTYPNDETAAEFIKSHPSHPLTQTASPRTTSNYYFNQLIGRGLDNEEIFHLKSHHKTFQLRKPNNDGIIAQGENVWGYTKNLNQTSSSHLPLIFDSSVSVGNVPSFSKRTWNGKIVIARLDGSTRTEVIGSSDPEKGTITKEINGRHMDIFSPEALEGGVCLPPDLKRIGSKN